MVFPSKPHIHHSNTLNIDDLGKASFQISKREIDTPPNFVPTQISHRVPSDSIDKIPLICSKFNPLQLQVQRPTPTRIILFFYQQKSTDLNKTIQKKTTTGKQGHHVDSPSYLQPPTKTTNKQITGNHPSPIF